MAELYWVHAEVGIEEQAIGVVVATYEFFDKVEFRDDDAAKGEGEEEKRGYQPKDLRPIY